MPTDAAAMHVLMVLESEFPAIGGGGAEAQVRTLANGLRARGHRVTVVTPMLPVGPQQKVSRVDGVPVCRLRYPRVRMLGGPVLWLRMACLLFRRRRRYDAWHVHIAHHLGAVCALLGDWLGKPVVVKVSGWWELEHGILAPHSSPAARLAFAWLRRASAWQAISQRIAAALVAKGVPRERLAAIPNAVDTGRFRRLARSDVPGMQFVFIGRLVPEKGLETLVEAFSRALGERREAELRIIGTGPLMPALRARAAVLGLADRVHFDGHRADIAEILAAADFGVLPSRIEGLSNTLLECMAAGLPTIASRVSGSEDLVRDGDNGWLFEPDDVAQLGECLVRAARLDVAQRRRMGERARDTVERHASLGSVLDRLLELYQGRRRPTTIPLPAVERGL